MTAPFPETLLAACPAAVVRGRSDTSDDALAACRAIQSVHTAEATVADTRTFLGARGEASALGIADPRG